MTVDVSMTVNGGDVSAEVEDRTLLVTLLREHLGLNRPIYAPSSAYGHFGRTAGEAGPGTFSWEAVDLADKLAAAV